MLPVVEGSFEDGKYTLSSSQKEDLAQLLDKARYEFENEGKLSLRIADRLNGFYQLFEETRLLE